MIPEDYKRLSPEVIAKIKPLTDDPETTDTGQLAARRYLADMGISLKTAIDARIGCLVHRCFGGKDSKDGKDKKNAAGMMYQCIAYVNYINRFRLYQMLEPGFAHHALPALQYRLHQPAADCRREYSAPDCHRRGKGCADLA